MKREEVRNIAEGYSVKILFINDAEYSEKSGLITIQNISRGGFRFSTDSRLELEDRLNVELTFPDGHAHKVSGRICYSDQLSEKKIAYGFSVLDGFYSLPTGKATA